VKDPRERLTAAASLFPKGQHLLVLEPYYKLMADGTLGVRVDNQAEVRAGLHVL
jgi:hypothetical protein